MDQDAKRKLTDQSKAHYIEVRRSRYKVEAARSDPFTAPHELKELESNRMMREKKWLNWWDFYGELLEDSLEVFENKIAKENLKCHAFDLALFEYGAMHSQEECPRTEEYNEAQKVWEWEKKNLLDPEAAETIWQAAMAEAAKSFAVVKGEKI